MYHLTKTEVGSLEIFLITFDNQHASYIPRLYSILAPSDMFFSPEISCAASSEWIFNHTIAKSENIDELIALAAIESL